MKPGSVSRSRAAVLVAALISLAALGADCEGNVVKDPTFRDWCGGSLCGWTLDSGRIQRVPTWNENDFGVSFTEVGTQISQVTQEHDAKCLLFTTIADIDPSAQMSISVDFNNDGTIDFQGPLGATSWHKVETEISAPTPYSGITFHVRKQGTGAAVLAEMRVVSTTGCKAPASRAPFLLGEGCESDSDCAPGLVCSSGGVCGQCDETRPCPGGVACGAQAIGLLQCGPGQGLGHAGDPCVLGADCASGSCEGASVSTLASLFDAADAGCPAPGPVCEVSATLEAGANACTCVVSHGGTCR